MLAWNGVLYIGIFRLLPVGVRSIVISVSVPVCLSVCLLASFNKMQLKRRQTSPPARRPGELHETYASSLILVHFLHCMKSWRHPQNRKCITYCTDARGGPSDGTDNIYKKFGEIRTCGFWDMRAIRQTNRQIEKLIQCFAAPTEGALIIIIGDEYDAL